MAIEVKWLVNGTNMCGGSQDEGGIDWGVHVLFILSVGLEVSGQFLLMV